MMQSKPDIASRLSKALIELQQILDKYYYYVYKLDVDPKNTGVVRHYRPRKGWTWAQCAEFVEKNPMALIGSLELLKKVTNQMQKQEEGEPSHE